MIGCGAYMSLRKNVDYQCNSINVCILWFQIFFSRYFIKNINETSKLIPNLTIRYQSSYHGLLYTVKVRYLNCTKHKDYIQSKNIVIE